MTSTDSSIAYKSEYRGLYRAGGAAALLMLAVMLAQVAIFITWPPPSDAQGFLALFDQNWLLGLLSMDLLYILNNTLIIPIYLALYAALKRSAPSAALSALALGLVGIAAYYASNTGFEMLSLSQRYAAAVDSGQRSALLGAAEAQLAVYRGTAFDVYYVLNAVALLIFSLALRRSRVFPPPAAYWGLAAAVLMSIPSTAGTIGLVFSLLSLLPWAVFALIIARQLLRMGKIS